MGTITTIVLALGLLACVSWAISRVRRQGTCNCGCSGCSNACSCGKAKQD